MLHAKRYEGETIFTIQNQSFIIVKKTEDDDNEDDVIRIIKATSGAERELRDREVPMKLNEKIL